MSEEVIIAITTAVTAIVAALTRYFEKRAMEREHKRELEDARNGHDDE